MATKSVRVTRPTVVDLVKAVQSKRAHRFTDEQLEQVTAAIDHNDREVNLRRRISSKALCELLNEHYGWRGSAAALEREVVYALGRKTWAKK